MSAVPISEAANGADPVRDDSGSLGLIVVNYGSHALLATNLRELGASRDVRVVVVDNFSDTAEQDAIRELAASRDWRLVELAVNVGFGAAVNRGATCAADLGCTELLLLNPDARLTCDALTALHAELSTDPWRAICPRIVTSVGQVEYRGAQVSLTDGRIRSISRTAGDDGSTVTVDGQVEGQLAGPVQGWLTGACLGISVALFEKIGGFDEDYFLYWEDVDLSRRIEQAGGRLAVLHHIRVVHDQGGTHGEPGARARSRTYYYYNCRNRLLFAAKHLDRASVLRWILSTRRESWQILLRGGRRQLLSSTVPLRATLRGSLAGIGLALPVVVRRRPVGPPPPMSVLVAHPGAELYGSDRMVLETVDALVAAGRDVTVALPGDGELVGELRRRGVRVEFCRVPVLRKSMLRPRGLARLLADTVRGAWPAVRLIRRFGSGGVYVNTVTIPSWLILSRLLRRRVVCHVHEAERSAPRLVRRVLALPALCADRVVVNSNYSLDVLSESLPRLRRRAEVVYNGIPGPPARRPARPEIVGPVRLLFVGRLSPRKGPDVAVAALRELVARGLDARLTLLGSAFEGYAWFEQQLRTAAASPELTGRVTFLGFENDVWPRLAGADIALIPSVLDEPFGNTAVEALLAGRPAVVSETSGLREAAAGYESAVFVPPGDPAALADAVEQLVRGWPHYARAADEDARLARERHDPQHYRAAIAAAVAAAGRRR